MVVRKLCEKKVICIDRYILHWNEFLWYYFCIKCCRRRHSTLGIFRCINHLLALNYSTDDILFFRKGDIKGKSNFSASRLLMNNAPPKIAQFAQTSTSCLTLIAGNIRRIKSCHVIFFLFRGRQRNIQRFNRAYTAIVLVMKHFFWWRCRYRCRRGFPKFSIKIVS